MKVYTNARPIIACSSGQYGNSAISVVRISGIEEIVELNSFFSVDLVELGPKKVQLTKLLKGDKVLDSVVVVYYLAPNSYTGENLLEISVHGNRLNVERIIETFTESGVCVGADSGEFTYRALENKKINLTQVEGLDLFLNASNPLMLDQGLDALSGDLYKEYRDLYENYKLLRASLEIRIDFEDDVGEEQSALNYEICLSNFIEQLRSLNERTKNELNSLLTPSVVVTGQTNAGKSTLFNLVLEDQRSIVSKTPGTTRDYVSESITIADTSMKMVDTAGLRDTSDNIEEIGIERTFEQINKSFFKILVVNPMCTDEMNLKQIQDMKFDLMVVTHLDEAECLKKFQSIKNLPVIENKLFVSLSNISGPIGPEVAGPIGPEVAGPIGPEMAGPIGPEMAGPIGAIGGEVVGERALFLGKIKGFIEKKYKFIAGENPILIARHRRVINSIYEKTLKYQEVSAVMSADLGVLASEINLVGSEINELIGIVTPDQVLTSIFDNFCIGK